MARGPIYQVVSLIVEYNPVKPANHGCSELLQGSSTDETSNVEYVPNALHTVSSVQGLCVCVAPIIPM